MRYAMNIAIFILKYHYAFGVASDFSVIFFI